MNKVKSELNESEPDTEQVGGVEDLTWIDRHEAQVDEEIRVYLAAHAGDEFSS